MRPNAIVYITECMERSTYLAEFLRETLVDINRPDLVRIVDKIEKNVQSVRMTIKFNDEMRRRDREQVIVNGLKRLSKLAGPSGIPILVRIGRTAGRL